MRQTNSTLTFLAAQYRAVLKDAYLKGLASTAIVGTAVMGSMGSAHAADSNDTQEQPRTELTDINQLADKNAKLVLSSSGDNVKKFELQESKEWNADLVITNGDNRSPHYIKSPWNRDNKPVTLKGVGSLTVESNNASVISIGENQGTYEFTMDIDSINVKQGGIRVKSGMGQGRNTRVAAKNIVIGHDKVPTVNQGEKFETYIHLAGQVGNDNAGAGTAILGTKDSNINFKSGEIIFEGYKSDKAVMEGNLTATGGTLDFQRGDGTIKTIGKTTSTNVIIRGGKPDNKNHENRGMTAVFDFDRALAGIEGSDANLVMDSGTISVGGYINSDDSNLPQKAGTMHVKRGTLDLGSAMTVESKDHNSGRILIGDDSVATQAKLKISKDQLNKFLNSGGKVVSGGTQGRVQLASGGTLYLKGKTSDEELDLNDITFGNWPMDGKVIVLKEGATVETDNLKIDKALTGSGGASLNVRAKHITFHEISDSGDSFNFKKATASDVDFVAKDSGGEFNLKNEVYISKSQAVDNPYNKDSNKVSIADSSTIDEKVTLESGGKLVFAAGNITTTGKISVKDGTVGVGGSPDSKDHGVNATWKVNGELELTNNSNNTINLLDNSTVDIPTETEKGKHKYQSRGKLDLTEGKLTVTGNKTNYTTIKATQSTLALNQENFDELLNTKGQRSGDASKGAAVSLDNYANLDLQGDLRALSGGQAVAFSTDKFKKVNSGASVESDHIGFTGSNNRVTANNVHLQGDELDIGSGNFVEAREKVVLDAPAASSINRNIDQALAKAQNALAAAKQALNAAQGIDGSVKASPANFTIKSGNVQVGSQLTATDRTQTITVGNDGAKAANVYLGNASLEKDQFNRLTADGQNGKLATYSPASGSVDVDLKLDGFDESNKAGLHVVNGKWTAQNIDATKNAHIVVGSDIDGLKPEQVQYQANSAPALKAKKVSLASGSNITISAPGKAEFDSLAMSGGAIDINGHMVVGSAPVGTPDDQKTNYAYDVKGGNINVTGRNAKLELGNEALAELKLALAQTKKLLSEDAEALDPAPAPVPPATNIDPNQKYTNNVAIKDAATLKLDFNKDQLLTVDDIKALRQEFIAQDSLDDQGMIKDGYLDIGDGKIAGINIKDNKVSWDELKPLQGVDGMISDVVNEELKQATLVDVKDGDTVAGNFGNIQLDNGGTKLNVGNTTLHNASGQNGNFIANKTNPTQPLGATVTSGSTLGLYNGGNIGDLNLSEGLASNDKTVLNVAGNNQAPTNITSISGGANTQVNLDATTVVEKNIAVEGLEINSDVTVSGDTNVTFLTNKGKPGQGTLTTQNLTVSGDSTSDIDFAGNLNVAQKAQFRDNTTLRGNNNFGDLNFEQKGHLASGQTFANNVTISAGKQLIVGSDKNGSQPGSSATLVAKNVKLNGGTLIADPEYGQKASIVAIGKVGSTSTTAAAAAQSQENEADHLAAILAQASANRANSQAPATIAEQVKAAATGPNASDSDFGGGVVDGKVVALQNSIVALGVEANDINQAMSEINAAFAPYMKNGSLQDPSTNADGVGAIAYVAKPVKLKGNDKIIVDATSKLSDYQKNSNKYNQGDVYLAQNSALAVSKNAATQANVAAVNIDKTDGKVYAERNAKVLITGANFDPKAYVKIFADKDGSAELVTEGNSTLAVQTVNGLFEVKGGLKAGKIDENIKLTLNSAKAGQLYHDTSKPVRDTILKYADLVAGQTAAKNELLNNTITINSGRDVEQVARMTDFGGSTKAAIDVANQASNAIASRMGVRSAKDNNAQVVASNRGAVWASGNYNKQRNRNFDAQGVDYGHDVDMGGMSAGMDFKVAPNVDVGAMVNFGTGQIKGRGAGEGIKNDIEYVGAGVYARAKQNRAQVVADVSYNQVKSKLEGQTAIGKATAEHNTHAISAGVTAQYDMDVAGVQVSPHAGVRYTHINTQDHDIKVNNKTTASYQGKDMNVVSLPVGVTVAKKITNGNWSIKPSLDLTVTTNVGDDAHKGNVKWSGIDNLNTAVNNTVLDKVNVGATAGVQFTNGNFSAGAGVGYTGSENSEDLTVGVNAQYKF